MRHRLKHFVIPLLPVWWFVIGSPQTAHAAKVAITITGTVAGANDISGVFGPPNSDLSKTKPQFTLVFTIDDTKGTSTQPGICGGVLYFSEITSTASSDPGTAALTINGQSFTFGVLNAAQSAALTVTRNAPGPNCGAGSQIYVLVGDGHYLGGSGLSGYVYPASRTILTPNASWEAPFANSNLLDTSHGSISFEISELGSTGQYLVNGELIPQTIAVSGPYTCSAGASPLLPPPTSGVDEHHYVVTNPICSSLKDASCTAANVFSLLREFPATVDEGHEVNTCDVTYLPSPLASSILKRIGATGILTLAGVLPISSSCLSDLWTLLTSAGGDITTYVDTSALSVTNVTLPNHPFYPGQVVRSVIQDNGIFYVQTVGTGTGPNACWNTGSASSIFWFTVPPLIWDPVDDEIRRHFMPIVPPLRGR
jgi:hypothetical protein